MKVKYCESILRRVTHYKSGVDALRSAGCGIILPIVVALYAVAIDCHAKHMYLSLKINLGVDLGMLSGINCS